jgi:hypothetical protein
MKTMHQRVDTKHDLTRMSHVQLARLGVELFNIEDPALKCVSCNVSWTAPTDRDGSLIDGWWLCPNKCNQ